MSSFTKYFRIIYYVESQFNLLIVVLIMIYLLFFVIIGVYIYVFIMTFFEKKINAQIIIFFGMFFFLLPRLFYTPILGKIIFNYI